MRDTLRLYRRYIGVSARAQLQYRASFVLQMLGQFGITAIEFFSIWALFHRFHRLGPWSLAEVGVFYGTVGLAWALADTVGRGFDSFGQLVKAGDFDRVLLRPRSTVFQLLAQDTYLRRIGRMVQAGAVLVWAWTELGLGADPARLGLLAAAVLGGAALFLGLLIILATISFWTVESLEIMNVLTFGGVTTAQYPLSVYPEWLRRFFVFFVPLGVTVYFPVVRVLGVEDPLGSPVWLGWSGPLAGFLFLGMALRLWEVGVRRYTSDGELRKGSGGRSVGRPVPRPPGWFRDGVRKRDAGRSHILVTDAALACGGRRPGSSRWVFQRCGRNVEEMPSDGRIAGRGSVSGIRMRGRGRGAP